MPKKAPVISKWNQYHTTFENIFWVPFASLGARECLSWAYGFRWILAEAILAAIFLHDKFKLREFQRELEQFQHSDSSQCCFLEELAAMAAWVVLFRFPGECHGYHGAVSNGR